jgi:hypothetical protein
MDDPLTDIPKIITIILGSGPKLASDQTRYYHENIEYKNFIEHIPSNKHSLENFIALNRLNRGNYLFLFYFFFFVKCIVEENYLFWNFISFHLE